jgi:hypothetical protein
MNLLKVHTRRLLNFNLTRPGLFSNFTRTDTLISPTPFEYAACSVDSDSARPFFGDILFSWQT